VEEETITIPAQRIVWSDWTAWQRLTLDARTDPEGVTPPNMPGVYEVRRKGEEERLTIGRTAYLRARIKRGLVKGKSPHSTGRRIRRSGEETRRLEVRWAQTDWPAAVEEALHKRYFEEFGKLPVYTKNT